MTKVIQIVVLYPVLAVEVSSECSWYARQLIAELRTISRLASRITHTGLEIQLGHRKRWKKDCLRKFVSRGLSHKRRSSGRTGTLVFPEDQFYFYGTARVLLSLLGDWVFPSYLFSALPAAVRAERTVSIALLSFSKCLAGSKSTEVKTLASMSSDF